MDAWFNVLPRSSHKGALLEKGDNIMAKLNKKLKPQQHYDGTTTKRVVIKGEPFEQISWAIHPACGINEPNEVTIYRLDREIETIGGVTYGSVIDLIYNKKNDTFRAKKVELPLDESELVLWLFGLPKKWRAKKTEEYQSMLAERMKMLCKDGEPLHWHKEFAIFGGKLAFAQKTVDSDPICLTGKIITGLADEAMREILHNRELRNLLAYEDIAVREIAKSRLGLTQDDFNEAKF